MTNSANSVGLHRLCVRNLAKIFTRGEQVVEALRDVSLEVAAGEFLAIMGPSGSGKSTLLHLMAGLDDPTDGKVEVAGQSLHGMSDRQLTLLRRRRIGLIFQAYNLIPTLTVADNVALPLVLDGKRPDDREIDSLLDRLGLLDRREHFPDQLSGGEQQRTAIARALIINPSVVLADEPTGNLDRDSSHKICELLGELCAEKDCAIIVVTHEVDVACWASTVRVLVDGRLPDEQYSPKDCDTIGLTSFYQDFICLSGQPAYDLSHNSS